MAEATPLTFLCITTYEKGQEFMRECKRQGCRVFLLTAETLRNADWPRESLEEVFYIPADLPVPEIVKAVTYLAREKKIDRIVALDEFDMETAATGAMRIPAWASPPCVTPRQASHANEGDGERNSCTRFYPGPESRRHSLLPDSTWTVGLETALEASAIGIRKIESPDHAAGAGIAR
jgi:hypothetical protein